MITQSDFNKISFESHGFFEPTNDSEKVIYRVPSDSKPLRNDVALRNAISNLVHDIKDSRKGTTIIELITIHCNISYATYKQYISRSGRPTRPFIAKLAVGLGLSLDQANALFRLHSGELNLTNDADFVTYHALRDHDSIDYYEAELKQYIKYPQ